MDKAVELTYSYEMPNGLIRKTVRYYNENLIRELLVNSLAHSSRTISNDITIKVISRLYQHLQSWWSPFGGNQRQHPSY